MTSVQTTWRWNQWPVVSSRHVLAHRAQENITGDCRWEHNGRLCVCVCRYIYPRGVCWADTLCSPHNCAAAGIYTWKLYKHSILFQLQIIDVCMRVWVYCMCLWYETLVIGWLACGRFYVLLWDKCVPLRACLCLFLAHCRTWMWVLAWMHRNWLLF